MSVVALGLLACGEGGAGRATVKIDTLPGGTIVVHNGARGLWDSASTWRIEEDLRIGSPAGEGPTSFNQIADLTVDGAGRIYVLEGQDQQLRVFDSTGRHVRTIGRKGGGPGEFKQAMGMAWDPRGRLWVVDQGNARYTILDTAGRVLEDHPRPFSNFFSGRWLGMMGADGTIYEMYRAMRTREVLLRVDSNLKVVDTIALPAAQVEEFKIEEESRSVSAPVPFTPRLQWFLDRRGFVWFGLTAPYRIYQRRLAGDTVRVIEREYRPLPVTGEEKDTALAHFKWFTDQGGKVDRSRIPDVKPAWNAIVGVDSWGDIWVDPVAGKAEARRVFDVFDPEGRYLGRVSSPFQFSSDPVFVGDRLYVVSEDQDGIPYVVRARISRRGYSGLTPWWQNWWQTETEAPDSVGLGGILLGVQLEPRGPLRTSKD